MDDLVLDEAQRLKCNADFEAMNARFDEIEADIANADNVPETKLDHCFTNGMYSRKLWIPAGSLLTSKIHMTDHQFIILSGICTVWNPHDGTVLCRAPHTGVTRIGTRRLIFTHTDCVWMTFHPTDKNTPEEVEADIIWSRVNQLINKKETHALTN